MSLPAPPQGALMASRIGLVAGPALAMVLVALQPLVPLEAGRDRFVLNAAAATAVLMAAWWLTEAVPFAVTGMAPLVLLPVMGILRADEVCATFGEPTVFLFIGGFLVGLVIEQTGLHKRLALNIVVAMGDNPRRIILGFMLSTAMVSMWMSNSATTMMLLPIALSMLGHADKVDRPDVRAFGIALLLGVSFASTIGGMSTPVGTLTNVYFAQTFSMRAPVSFGQWLVLAGPLSLAFLLAAWLLLTRAVFRVSAEPLLGGRSVVAAELQKLGPMRTEEKRAAMIFLATALLWVLREPIPATPPAAPAGAGQSAASAQPPNAGAKAQSGQVPTDQGQPGWGWAPLLGLGKDPRSKARAHVGDDTVAIAMALLCFFIPARGLRRPALLNADAIRKIPWDIVLVFGGGVALAKGMESSGLSAYLGDIVARGLSELSPLLQICGIAAFITFLSELTSNVATAQLVLPILDGTARELNVDARLLMVPATLAASCGFMLPIATPPNTIVFGTGRVPVRAMLKAGLWMNLVGIALIVLVTFAIGVPVLRWRM